MNPKKRTLDDLMKVPPVKTDTENKNKFETIVDAVLSPHEVLRDPIHGDVWITLLERNIIDTLIFQNLRRRMQLGPTCLVYPGATHTRFEHSIGTLYMAAKLVDICNRNYEKYPRSNLIKIAPYQRLIIRLVALLHDVTHIPFGHTLEREGNLFSKHEWKDDIRANEVLGEGAPVHKAVVDTLKLFDFSEEQIKKLIDDVYDILTYDGESMNLEYPFIYDIVGNTLCADLLDYSIRDMYYCGLAERFGDRFLNYLAVLPLAKKGTNTDEEFVVKPISEGGKSRLVLLSYRYERDRQDPKSTRPVFKLDVLSEAIDLLRKRYSLAEKVYFHRTKIDASAMVISAVESAGLKPDELFKFSDEQLLFKLCESNNKRARHIANNYMRRNLYKPIYRIEYKEKSEYDEDSRKLWEQIYVEYRKPEKRSKVERQIEEEMGLNPGSIVIYCPESGMNTKQFEALVHPQPYSLVKPLRLILDSVRKKEMEVINEYFQRLWRLEVLVDPEQMDPSEVANLKVRQLSGLCEEIFDLPNDIQKLRGTRQEYEIRLLNKIAKEWDSQHPDMLVPHKIVEELMTSAKRYSSDKDALQKLLQERVMKHYGKT